MPKKTREKTASRPENQLFAKLADQWWDENGAFAALHLMNPVRLSFLGTEMGRFFPKEAENGTLFTKKTALDIGCGGGIFSESLARLGFVVTGIDASPESVSIARAHAEKSGLDITYLAGELEGFDFQEKFDLVAAMEVIEHVRSPALFIRQALACLKPGGCFIGSTLNRTMQSWLFAVFAAEHILHWAPIGAHDWNRFVKPSEFAALLRKNGASRSRLRGIAYDLAKAGWKETPDLGINYMIFALKNDILTVSRPL